MSVLKVWGMELLKKKKKEKGQWKKKASLQINESKCITAICLSKMHEQLKWDPDTIKLQMV